MTTFWPKRDEQGRHVNTGAEHGGAITNFKPSCEPDHVETLKPLSELLAKLDPDVVERAMADVHKPKCAKCNGKGFNLVLHSYIGKETIMKRRACRCTE